MKPRLVTGNPGCVSVKQPDTDTEARMGLPLAIKVLRCQMSREELLDANVRARCQSTSLKA